MSRKPTKSKTDGLPLPVDVDTERRVLGAILLDNDLYYRATAIGLAPEDFFDQGNHTTWAAVSNLIRESKPADIVTVVEKLGSALGSAGGATNIASLTTDAEGLRNIESYVEILKDKRLRRQVIHLATNALAMAPDPGESIRFVLSGIAEDAMALSGRAQDRSGAFVREYTADVIQQVEDYYHTQREVIGLPYGIQELDEMTTGLRQGELVIIGGRPGQGKTGFAITVLVNNARQGTPVAMFSVEMSRQDVVLRMLAQLSGISHTRLRNPRHLMGADVRALDHWREELDKLPILIDDDNQITAADLEARARLYIAKHKVELVVVDYVQIVLTEPGDEEYDRVTAVANVLMRLARATGVPVMALSQLRRGESKDPNVKPLLQDLRASGQIEQNANTVIMVYHPMEEDTHRWTGKDELIISKQRAGSIGPIKAYYDPRTLRWEAREEKAKAAQAEMGFEEKKPKVSPDPKPAPAIEDPEW